MSGKRRPDTKDVTSAAPAMGERYARWGYGYQDKCAAQRILDALKDELRHDGPKLIGVRLADLDAGRVDDCVLVWERQIEGISIKWDRDGKPLGWGGLVGTSGLLKELVDGHQRLRAAWPDSEVKVRLQTSFPAAETCHHRSLVTTLSVNEFLRDHWEVGATAAAEPAGETWRVIESHTGLSGEALDEFVGACTLCVGVPQPPNDAATTEDDKQYVRQFKRLHRALATWLTDNPGSGFVGRQYLLAAIGLRPYRSELLQRFPSPHIPYTRNEAAAEELGRLLADRDGGYVAVTGSAGVGKSTLVQDLLRGRRSVAFIPYFAFLPSGEGNPRDRGEALTFFENIIGRLDRMFPGRSSLGIDSVAHGRDALREHMANANREFFASGRKTVLLIDGLDHVAREVGLGESILWELPRPEEVPDGFVIMLSARPEALRPNALASGVGAAVAASTVRRVVIDGLTRSEVHQIVAEAIDEPSTEDRDVLYHDSRGNPLILTYLLSVVRSSPGRPVVQAIADTANFEGDIDRFYEEAFARSLQDVTTRRLLGLLCRAAPTIPGRWLQSWPEEALVEEICQGALAPFLREEGDNLVFVHNSLVSFLMANTRSGFPGADHAAVEAGYHSELADRSDGLPCSDPLGRAHLFHLARAGRDAEVLDVATSAWFREATRDFVPYELVRPILLEAIGVAWRLEEHGHVTRLVLLDSELSQRSTHLGPESLAKTFLELGRHELALAHVRANGRLLVDDAAGLRVARQLWVYAKRHQNSELGRASRQVYDDAKPIGHLQHGEPVEAGRFEHEVLEVVREWSGTAPLFEPVEDIIDSVEGLEVRAEEGTSEIDAELVKASLLYRSLRAAVGADLGAATESALLEAMVRRKKPDWELAAGLLCGRDGRASVPTSTLLELLGRCSDRPDLALQLAEQLYQAGDHGAAKEILEGLTAIDFDNHPTTDAIVGISSAAALVCLRQKLGLAPIAQREVTDDGEEALARVELAAQRLGALRCAAGPASVPGGLRRGFKDVLLYQSQKVARSEYDRTEHFVIGARSAVFDELLDVAASFGAVGMRALRDVVLEVVKSAPSFLGTHCRWFATEFHRAGVLGRGKATELALSCTADADEEDPMARQEGCFDVAVCLNRLGSGKWVDWVRRAGRASAGAGSHKDYRMAHLAGWLEAALVGGPIGAQEMSVVEKFTRALEVAGGDGQFEAAGQVLSIVLGAAPSCVPTLAAAMIERGLTNLSGVLEAFVSGGVRRDVDSDLLSAVFEESLSLVASRGMGRVAASLVEAAAKDDRGTLAKELMSYIQINSVSSERVDAARRIQDVLVRGGGVITELTAGHAGRDDESSREWLYGLSNGEVLTIEQVAAWVRSSGKREEWDPNPTGNERFDWWEVLRKAVPLDIDRLDEMLALCPEREYRMAEVHGWRTVALVNAGRWTEAQETAQAALDAAREGSWFERIDGGQRRAGFSALSVLDADEARNRSRRAFGEDLARGNLPHYFLESELVRLFGFLDLPWPSQAALDAIDAYADEVLAACADVAPYDSLHLPSGKGKADEAIIRFLVSLFAIPALDVGRAARRAFSSYLARTTCPFLGSLVIDANWSDTELEYMLAAVDIASRKNRRILNRALREVLQPLNRHESLAVRSVARRICVRAGWGWTEVRDERRRPRVYVGSDIAGWSRDESGMLLGGDVVAAWRLFGGETHLLEEHGIGDADLASEFETLYLQVAEKWRWDSKGARKWARSSAAARHLLPRAMIGRAALMKLLGRHTLEGSGPDGAEDAYDGLHPLYDAAVELVQPRERPPELRTLDWGFMDSRKEAWAAGAEAEEWSHYPDRIGDLHLIGEFSHFVIPDRDVCQETRIRGVLEANAFDDEKSLSAGLDLTRDLWLWQSVDEREKIVAYNDRGLLGGGVYRWASLSSRVAAALDWKPSVTDPFGWLEPGGDLMVRSLFWRDGRVGMASPGSSETLLGEGWCLLATDAGLEALQNLLPHASVHLLVKRERLGMEASEQSWHLARSL